MIAVVLNDLDGKAYAVEKPKYLESLTFMQRIVEGLISLASLRDKTIPLDMFVNDEGLDRSDFAFNFNASVLYGAEIFGPALLIGCSLEGETIGVSKLHQDAFNTGEPMSLETFLELRALLKLDLLFDDVEEIS